MARLSAQERLAILQNKATQLAVRVDKAKAVMKSDERKRDDRRKIIIGALVIDLLAKKTPLPKSLDGFLQLLTRDNDRLPFEGWTLDDDKAGVSTAQNTIVPETGTKSPADPHASAA